MKFISKNTTKRFLALVLAVVMTFSNMAICVTAEETTNQVQEETETKTYYRYREKVETTSDEELNDPWILYNTTTVYTHSGYTYIYLDGYEVNGTGTASGYTYDTAYQWKLDNYDKYCFHGGPTEVYKYMKKTTPYTYIYVTSSADVDYTQYSFVRQCWQFRICSEITESLKYHYYQWSDWSDWSEVPVDATDNIEVETKIVALFTIIYDANGGTGVPEATTKEQDVTIALSEIVPTRENHQFLGWSTTSDGNVEYAAGSEYSANKNVTLYAVWKNITKYTVTYDANGGVGALAQQNKMYNENLTLSSEIPTREGYTFLGWSTEKDGEVDYAPESVYSANADITLYAVWKNITEYTVTYDANGGVGAPAQQSKMCDESITLSSEIPTREGYTFLGWSTEKDGEVDYAPESVYSTNADILLYATWEKNMVVVTSGVCGDNLTWVLNEEGALIINGTGDMWDWDPYEDRLPPWESVSYLIDSIVINEGVTSVGSFAFDSRYGSYYQIQNIHLPESLNSINCCAFYDCEGLTDIDLPDNISYMAQYAFGNCSGLTTIKIPRGITRITYSTFADCHYLTSVIMGKQIEYIGNGVFYCNWNLKDIYYEGSKENWENIEILTHQNSYLLEATVHYNVNIYEEDQKDVIYGDVNSDGVLNTADAREVLCYCLGVKEFTNEQRELSDYDQDGEINTSDVRNILLAVIA